MNARALLGIGVVITCSLLVMVIPWREEGRRPSGGDDRAPWRAHIRAVDEALQRGDVGAASRARHEAYIAAIVSRGWEGLIEAGDAARRIGDVATVPQPYVESARANYLAALFRARAF